MTKQERDIKNFADYVLKKHRGKTLPAKEIEKLADKYGKIDMIDLIDNLDIFEDIMYNEGIEITD